MDEQTFETIRLLPRGELERFAMHVLLDLRMRRQEAETGRVFSAVLGGFLLGAVVASVAFLVGSTLG